MPVLCFECDKFFSTQFNLNKHLRNVHNKIYEWIEYGSETKYMCVECSIFFKFNRNLRTHLEQNHNFKNDIEYLQFKNFDEFNQWLSEEQKVNNVQYVRNSGKKVGSNYEQLYFECRRSYKKQNLVSFQNRKRKLKSQGSCKLNKSCISQIVVKRNLKSDHCDITYYKSHYLHGPDEIQHLQIPKSDKEMIASNLILGVSSKEILQKMRTNKGEDLKRTDLLTSTDIRNIQRAFHLDLKDGLYHKDDATSVNVWVKHCAEADNEKTNEEVQHLTSQLSNNKDKIKEKVKNNIYEMLLKLDGGDFSDEQLDLWLQHTNTCLALSSVHHKNKYQVKDEDMKKPRNTNIAKQKSFHSTKKECHQKKTVYSKASKEDFKVLDEFVNSDLFMSNTAENDHLYC